MALDMPVPPRHVQVPCCVRVCSEHTYSKSVMVCLRHHLFWVIVGLVRMTMRLWDGSPILAGERAYIPEQAALELCPKVLDDPAIQDILEGIAHIGSQLVPNMPSVYVEKSPLLPTQVHISCHVSCRRGAISQDGRQLQGSTNPALLCSLQGFCPKEESAVPGMELASISAQVTSRTFPAWIVCPGSR